MAFYTAGIKTHLLDPVHDNPNFRTEFRFKADTVYLSNLRLADVGFHNSNGEKPYNHLAGIWAGIQSIHLYDNNTLLDQLLDVPKWLAFTQYNKPNVSQGDLGRETVRHNLGFQVTKTDITKAPVIQHAPSLHGIAVSNAEGSETKGWLSLKSVLPMLDNSQYLPTGVFKNLKLVIQYSKNLNTAVIGGLNIKSSREPYLICDEIVNIQQQASINQNYKGVQFLAIEHDRVYLGSNETAAGKMKADDQPASFTLSGFDNKTINRFVLVKTPTVQVDDVSPAVRDIGSVAQIDEVIQIRVNGQNKFPGNGIGRPNERLALLTDTWGTCNTLIGMNDVGTGMSAPVKAADGSQNYPEINYKLTSSFGSFLGNVDYFGCSVQDFVQEFVIDYKRGGVTAGGLTANPTIVDAGTGVPAGNPELAGSYNAQHRFSQPLQLNFFAEANKSIVVGGGKYTVGYA